MHRTNSVTFALALSLTALLAATSAAPIDSTKAPIKSTAAAVPAPVAPKDTSKAATPALAAPIAPTAPAPSAVVTKDSAKVAVIDTAGVDSVASDSAKAGHPKKRMRIVRETTVNSIDELKGRYRSPKKAMFMSLLVPGLGQAYVGQHWVNYTRAAAYFLTDVALAYGWHYYVVDRQNAQIANYRKFADQNWTQARYEDHLKDLNSTPFDKEKFDLVNPHRQSYCEAVQNRDANKGSLFAGCVEGDPQSSLYQSFKDEYKDNTWSTDSISSRRAQFPDPHTFYELLGKEVEFIQGWNDADNVRLGDSTFFLVGTDGTPLLGADKKPLPAITANQQEYIYMRAKANDYARMQAYFLGGMVVNHLVSALDAALTAHYHNKSLYQTEVRWWDRVHLDGGLAWQGIQPASTVTARVTF